MEERPRLVHKSPHGVQYKGIPVNAVTGLHEACMDILQGRLPSPAHVLDIAAGHGAFTRRLLDAGYRVQANDLDSNGWAVPEVALWTLDLNKPVPPGYASRQFDAVVAIEVIEHLENPLKFLRDCCSFCRPGGIILLTTPNVVDIRSLGNFLLCGYLSNFSRRFYWESGHSTLLPFWLMEEHLRKVGITQFERMGLNPVRLQGIRNILHVVQWMAQLVSDMPIPKELRSRHSLCYACVAPDRFHEDDAIWRPTS